ncbi:MAG: hypothetical protein E6Q97_05420 [Desulfurellales bacterium]|nr:MAG: hypothetical protein E6Q97_05420 [Desulfurellales bacterium]
MSKWPSFIDKQPRPSNVIHIAPQTTIDDRVMAVERAQDKVRATHEAHEAAQLELMDALKLLRDDLNGRELGIKVEIET